MTDSSSYSGSESDSDTISDSDLDSDVVILTDDDLTDACPTIYELTHEYVQNHVLGMHEPTFHECMEDDIANLLYSEWKHAGLCSENQKEYIKNHCELICNDYFNLQGAIAPRRSRPTTAGIPKERYKTILTELMSIEQPEQRTPEWYEFRHDLISASSLGKIFGTDASRNRLIYEKCQSFDSSKGHGAISVSSPMHWGQKYEPVSCALYEHMFSTKVSEFGCIRHRDHPFIGASPDGIITKPGCSRYGRMLEIKNIVNREITGIPLKDYWIQMQMQMECCDLDECDFLETQFKEYEDEAEFLEDATHSHKGVILYFVERVSIGRDSAPRPRSNTYPNSEEMESSGRALAQQYSGVPRYEYMPLDMPLDATSVNTWIEQMRTKLRRSWSLYTPIYWYLDQYSCVLVERNRQWFKEALLLIENTWKTIEQERETGCEHRAPAKKSVKVPCLEVVTNVDDGKELRNFPLQKGVCLVKLGGNSDELHSINM